MSRLDESVISYYRSILDRVDFLLVDIKIIPLTDFKLNTLQGIQDLNKLHEVLTILKARGEINNFTIDANSLGSYLCVQYKSPSLSRRSEIR